MKWRSETYLDIAQRLMQEVSGLKVIGLFNNQFDDMKSDNNNEYPFNFPCCFIAFQGGEWKRLQDLIRYSEEYIFRLHIGIEAYDDNIEHLDLIEDISNALDNWKGGARHVQTFKFLTESIDEERTNVIEHIIEFQGRVVDCSLKEKTDGATITHVATDLQIKAILEGLPNWAMQSGYFWHTMDGESWATTPTTD